MNPSFRPPPPMSDAQRADIYRAFQQDPQKFSVRTLAQLHGVSMKRIDAVLRLKGMEDAWRKVSFVSLSRAMMFSTISL